MPNGSARLYAGEGAGLRPGRACAYGGMLPGTGDRNGRRNKR